MQITMASEINNIETEWGYDIYSIHSYSSQQGQDEENELAYEDFPFWCDYLLQNLKESDEGEQQNSEQSNNTEHNVEEKQGQEKQQDRLSKKTIIINNKETRGVNDGMVDTSSSSRSSMLNFLSDLVPMVDNCMKKVHSFSSWDVASYSKLQPRIEYHEDKTDEIIDKEVVIAVPLITSSSCSVTSQESTITSTLQNGEVSTITATKVQEKYPRTIWFYTGGHDDDQLCHNADNNEDKDDKITSTEKDKDASKFGYEANDCTIPSSSNIRYIGDQSLKRNSTFESYGSKLSITNMAALDAYSPPPPVPSPEDYHENEPAEENVKVATIPKNKSKVSSRTKGTMIDKHDNAEIIDQDSSSSPTLHTTATINTTTTPKGSLHIQPYQNDKWMRRYKALIKYREQHGHCNVPFQTYKKKQRKNDDEKEGEPVLSQWVKRQRHQYKLKWDGKKSHMTNERIQLLEDIGFMWDSHAAAWEENYELLRNFRQEHGHCHVPVAQPRLSTWIKRQRRQYKKFIGNEPSTMTQGRIDKLDDLGFVWFGTESASSNVKRR